MIIEKVVLLDDNLNSIGETEKATVHTMETPLHLAFSCFIFNGRGELLVQQRALSKITWPGVWSNSCCGHPMPGESVEDAVYRRLKHELGYDKQDLQIFEALPDFRYKAEFKGVVENEFCPVWIARCDKLPNPNPDEVNDYKYISWNEFIECILDPTCSDFDHFSIWCRQEAKLLHEADLINKLLN